MNIDLKIIHFREAKRAINNFLCLGCRTVVITLGKDGAIFASASEPRPIHVRAPKVEEVLDTTVRMMTVCDGNSINDIFVSINSLNAFRVLGMHSLVRWPII